jgi:hypothetical protein
VIDRRKSYAMCNAQAGMRRIADTCLSLEVNDSLDSVMDVRWQRLCRKRVLEIREQTAGQHGGRNHKLYSNDIIRYEVKKFPLNFRNSSSPSLLHLAERVWIQLAGKSKPEAFCI